MYAKPMPLPTRTSQPFWDALRDHRLMMQRCKDCDRWIWYPRPHCHHCGSRDWQWLPLSGEATLYSVCVSPRPTAPMFADETPQALALVELAEGPRLTTTLVGAADAAWRVGMPLAPVFDDSGPVTLLRFGPVAGQT